MPGRSASVFEVAVENSFDFHSTEYRTLFDASEATAFQHPSWLSALYRGLLTQNSAAPLVVVVRNSVDRSLAMVLPLVRRHYGMLKVVEFADLRVSDYAAAVTSRANWVKAVADISLRRQIRSVLEPFDLLRIGKLQDGTLPMNQLFGIAEATSMPTNAYAVPLAPTFDAWRSASLDPSYARELGKKARQLARAGDVSLRRAMTVEEVDQTFEQLRIFRHDRFEQNGGGELLQVPAYFDFYASVARDTSFARTYRMTINGEIIAGALGLTHRGALLVVLSGFTQTEYKNKSIGSLLFEQIARDSIESGDTLLDFTIGDEPYKMTFGAKPKPMWQMSRAGSPLGYAAAVVVDRLPAAKALARSMFHPSRRKGRGPSEPPASGGDAATMVSEVSPPSPAQS